MGRTPFPVPLENLGELHQNCKKAAMTATFNAGNWKAWLFRMGYTYEDAARALGISVRTAYNYSRQEHEIPKLVELACEALETRYNQPESRQRVYQLFNDLQNGKKSIDHVFAEMMRLTSPNIDPNP